MRTGSLKSKLGLGLGPAFFGRWANSTCETVAVEQIVPGGLIPKHPTKYDGREDDSDGNELVAVHKCPRRLTISS
jgi:hypothetical protein